MKHLIVLFIAALTAGHAAAQEKVMSPADQRLCTLARTDIGAFAREVSSGATTDVERAHAIVAWLTRNFDWKYTDYQKRTVAQIIERRGGNCNDLAMVALAAMNELHIRLRKVHEVNIYTNTPDRGERAHALVKEKGNTYSVFGRHHNDHVYLEIYDPASDQWFPADPWTGLVGVREWMTARVGFGKRSGPNPDAADMIVPFAIYAADAGGNFTVDRTRHYLVDEFDRLYDGRLHTLPAWKQWVALLDRLHDKVEGAFVGTTDLHDYEADIDALASTYEQLRDEYQSATRRSS